MEASLVTDKASTLSQCLFSSTDTSSSSISSSLSLSPDEPPLCLASTVEESAWYDSESLDEMIQGLDCIFTASQDMPDHNNYGYSLEEQDLYPLCFPPLSSELSQSSSHMVGSSPESNSEDLSTIFAKWLRSNSDSVTINDLKNIKLRTSTIENAMRRLGGGRKGMTDLLKLVLAWLERYRLPHKRQKREEEPQDPKLCHSHGIMKSQDEGLVAFEIFTSPCPLQELKEPSWDAAEVGAVGGPSLMPSRDASDAALESPRAATTRAARRNRMARQRWSIRRARIHTPNALPVASQAYSRTIGSFPLLKQITQTQKSLRLLLHKELKQSDVGSLGRIVLPKKEAELYLPCIVSSDGIKLVVEDWCCCRAWNVRYCFWTNNRSRMYLLENTGDFVNLHQLEEGDHMLLYADTHTGKFVIRGMKAKGKDMIIAVTDKKLFKLQHQ